MTTSDVIASVLGDAPDYLVSYFEAGHFRERPDANIRCLSLPEAAEYSRHILAMPFGKHFGLFALDDANDSNPFCCVTRGPCAGAVMHLSHDGDTYVSHRSLNSFLQSLDSLDEDSQIDDLQAEPNIFFDTLETLDRLLSAFDEDCLIPVYLRVTQRLPRDTKTKLTEGGDYFIQESFAEWLILHGDSTDLPFAQRLASTGYQPVVNPARRAIDRLKRLAR